MAEHAFYAAGEAELDRMMERWERDDAKYGKVTYSTNHPVTTRSLHDDYLAVSYVSDR